MKIIDGKKYICEEEFDNAVASTLSDIMEFSIEKDAGTGGMLAIALMTGEFAKLGVALFDDDSEKKETKTTKSKTKKGGK